MVRGLGAGVQEDRNILWGVVAPPLPIFVFQFQVSGFRDHSSGFRVQGLGYIKVQSSELRV